MEMDFNLIISAVVLTGVVALLIGLLLGIAGKFFAVEVDEKEVAVRNELPGNNCGGCGFPGCDGLAHAIACGQAPVNGCPVGGEPVAEKIAAIMGVDAGASEKKVAFVRCGGTCDKAGVKSNYYGVNDCAMAMTVPGQGSKTCNYGCMGFGTCVKACPFDAIHVVNGVAVVDREACKACGKCVAACPKNLIELIPYKASYFVGCQSKDKGKDVRFACEAGCIGCGLCMKNCEAGAIKVEGNLATIDPSLCTGCGTCFEKCPTKAIKKIG